MDERQRLCCGISEKSAFDKNCLLMGEGLLSVLLGVLGVFWAREFFSVRCRGHDHGSRFGEGAAVGTRKAVAPGFRQAGMTSVVLRVSRGAGGWLEL